MLTETTVENEDPGPRQLTVLVADDAMEVQAELRAWLEEAGHRVFCVGSGLEATRVVRERTVDLIITEVILPNGDGLELISAAKRVQPAARVIAYSGGGKYLSIGDCLRVAKGFGAFETLPKPATKEQMLALVARAGLTLSRQAHVA